MLQEWLIYVLEGVVLLGCCQTLVDVIETFTTLPVQVLFVEIAVEPVVKDTSPKFLLIRKIRKHPLIRNLLSVLVDRRGFGFFFLIYFDSILHFQRFVDLRRFLINFPFQVRLRLDFLGNFILAASFQLRSFVFALEAGREGGGAAPRAEPELLPVEAAL